MPANYDLLDYVEKRVRYFDGQFLKDQDFIDDQKYHLDRQRRLSRSLYVSGICEGLTITPDRDKVTVAAGTALDPQGRQLVLGAAESVPLSEYRGQVADLLMVYQAIATDPAQEGSEGHTRWHERPQIVVVIATDDSSSEQRQSEFLTIDQNGTVIAINLQAPVRLGQLTIDQEGNVAVKLNDPFRQYSGIYLPAPNSSGPILRSGGEQTDRLAILTGDLSISGSLGIGLTTPSEKLEIKYTGTEDQQTNFLSLYNDGDSESQESRIVWKNGSSRQAAAAISSRPGRNHNAGDLRFQTAANGELTEHLILNSVGYVGLGTDNPGAKLEINASTTTAGSWLEAIRFTPNENSAITHPGGGLLFGLHGDRNFYFADIQDGTFQKYVMQIEADTGNVGIGIKPSAKLDVNGDIETQAINLGASNRSSHLESDGAFYRFNGQVYLSVDDNLYIRDMSSEIKMHFDTNASRLGIGGINPSYPLHVTQAISNSWQALFNNGSTNVYLSHQGGYGISINTGKTNSSGRYGLEVRNASQTHFFVRDDGRVGLGTTGPAGTLDVRGDIHAGNSDLYFTDTNHRHTGFGNNSGYAAIENASDYAALMILGRAGTSKGRTVKLWDYLEVNGQLSVKSVPFGDKRNMQWDDVSGLLYYDNSTHKHKENIIDLDDDFSKILGASPKTYTRPGNPGDWEIGYIAEEFHELGLNRLIFYDQKGDPESINYRKISLYLVEVVKTLKQDLKLCLDKVKTLESQRVNPDA